MPGSVVSGGLQLSAASAAGERVATAVPQPAAGAGAATGVPQPAGAVPHLQPEAPNARRSLACGGGLVTL